MDHESMSFMRLEPAAFAARLAEPTAFVVNVHTPFEGAIDGTDAFIPFDEVVDDPRLPSHRDTMVLLYCESGRMSEIAARALIAAGYTDVVDLDGGMQAWERSGMVIEERPGADD
jgi:phage shock protein E